MDYNIYISYRKSDGGALAQSIFMSLQQKGYKCFFDFAIMRMGDTFEDQIRNVIKTSKNFIFIMTPLAVSGCLREHDWVAHELKIAIDSGCNIIPVVSADNPIEYNDVFSMFPSLSRINPIHLHEKCFDKSISELIHRLVDVPVPSPICNNPPIFISYSRKDFDQVYGIKSIIEDSTGVECWMDLEGIPYNSPDFVRVIVKAINEAQIFLFMLTENSQKSVVARGELTLAIKKNKHIVFLNVNNCEMIDEFTLLYSQYNVCNFTNEKEQNKLLKEVKKWLLGN